MSPTDPLARFSARVQHATNGCWLWQGASVKGRGQIYVNGKNMLATRFAYQQFKGEIPDGMYVCHTCDDPSCVNPNHLWLGTARDNWQDARRKRRALQGIKREVCPQGHEYSGRECLTCRDARNKKRDHRAYRLAAQARRDAEVIALRARVAELEERLDAMMPLFEEARDALPAISLESAKLRGIRLDLADRMDDVGDPERWAARKSASAASADIRTVS